MNSFGDLSNCVDYEIPENWNWSDLDMVLAELMCSGIENDYSKAMNKWSPVEVLDFLVQEIQLNPYAECLKRFECISGYIFMHLTEYNCKVLSNSDQIGTRIYNAKEKYLRYHPCNDFTEVTDPPQYFADDSNGSISNSTGYHIEDVKPERRPGRPRSIASKLGRRSQKLWEFLLHLLRDSNTCPQLIRWENFEEGTFKFVQNDQVARLWGNRKKNENMNYEKFSRAMRYYYKSKVLLPVPGRRLVYKFGPQAKGWKSIAPIY